MSCAMSCAVSGDELTAETFVRAFRVRRQFDGSRASPLPWHATPTVVDADTVAPCAG
jgi:DNA-directed RNA polymerase specialized sigma24 family protein